MWELEHKKVWVPKNWCFQTVVLEKTLESPLDCKEIKPVHPKGNQSWIFIGRTDADAEAPILWPPDAKSRLIWKDPDARKDWGQEKKGTTEDEMVGRHHHVNGHEFGWTLGVGDGQGGLVCYGSWGRKESDTTERLNNKISEVDTQLTTSCTTGMIVWGALPTCREVHKYLFFKYINCSTNVLINKVGCFDKMHSNS